MDRTRPLGRRSALGGGSATASASVVKPGRQAAVAPAAPAISVSLVVGGLSSPDFDTAFNISSFGKDQGGELYVCDLNGGVYKVMPG